MCESRVKSLKSLSLSAKLAAVFAVPALGFALISWNAVSEHRVTSAEVARTNSEISLHRSLRTAALAVGGERLAAAELVQSSGSSPDSAALEAAVAQTDAALLALEQFDGGQLPLIPKNALGQARESLDRARSSGLRRTESYRNATNELLKARTPVSNSRPEAAIGTDRSLNLVADFIEATDNAWINFAERRGTDTRSAVAIGASLAQADQLRTSVDRDVGGRFGEPVDIALENTEVMPLYAVRATEDLVNDDGSAILGADALATLRDSRARWLSAMADGENIAADQLSEASEQAASARTRVLLISGAVAVLLGLGAGHVFGTTARTVRALTRQTEEITLHELPDLVQGDPFGEAVVVPDRELPPSIDRPDDHELGDLTSAISELHSAAVAVASTQRRARLNTSQAFAATQNRSHRLVEQIMQQLNKMLQTEEDPQQLASLRALSHMVTRLRRSNESGLVLSGAPNPRTWEQPIPIEVVVRGALSETFNYERIHISALPAVAIRGDAASDLSHILAELLDNGVQFSQPPDLVNLNSRIEGHSLVLTITDSGSGMTETELLAANTKLHTNPRWDEVDPQFLGLFIAGRLAERHGVSLRLLEGVDCGTAARITLGPEVIREIPGSPALPINQDIGQEGLVQAKLSRPEQAGTPVPPVPAALRPQSTS